MLRGLLAFLLMVPLMALGDAGKLDSFEGDVRITGKGGLRRAAPGLVIEEGDTVRTATNAWALFEMSDGASITVRAATEMRVTRYRFTEDGPPAKNSSSIDIVKGALRIITGLIGSTNRSGYSINTATATMGVRGTDHEPAFYPADDNELDGHEPGAFDKVNEGETFIRNLDGEETVIPRGRVAFMGIQRGLRPRLLEGEPLLYRRQAKQDLRVAARREAMLQRIQERRKQRQQELREKKAERSELRPEKKSALEDKREAIRERLQEKRERRQDKSD